MSGALVVFAKEPKLGTVKTRLSPPLSLEEATEFYGCMLDDVLEHSATLATAAGLSPFLYVAPAESVPGFERRAPARFEVRAQRGDDLGARMESAAAELAAAGFSPIVLRGSDSPALDEPALTQALHALATGADVAASPDPDGGYGLIALRAAVPGLFSHPMSTASVLADTFARASARSLRCVEIEPGFDIDTSGDLDRLARAREERASLPCPRTLAYLDAHDLWTRTRTRNA